MLSAAASYLDARHQHGRWHLRIDDIDPPRAAPNAAETIQRDLERMALYWDGPILFQSSRLADYAAASDQLLARGNAYRCRCSRRDLRATLTDAGFTRYPGTCRQARIAPDEDAAVRIAVAAHRIEFVDRVQGPQSQVPADSSGDFVIYRRDHLPAYHLATVLDEAYLGISDVVRGVDLLDTTPSQILLQQAFGFPTPRYAHVPVVVNARGQKLSKQTGARAAVANEPGAVAWDLLTRLGLNPPDEARDGPPSDLWAWAIPRWSIERLAGQNVLRESPGIREDV